MHVLGAKTKQGGPSAPYAIRPRASTKARVVEAAGKRCSNPIDAWWTSCLEQQRPPPMPHLIGLSLPSWDLSKHSTSFAREGWKTRLSSLREAVGDALLQSKY